MAAAQWRKNDLKYAADHSVFGVDSRTDDLAARSVRAGLSTSGGQIAQFALRLVSTAVLARLLTPSDFGLVAMVAAVIGFVDLIKDAGLSTATVQSDSVTHEQVSVLFWANLAIGGVLAVCVAAAAPVVAWFFKRPELGAVTIVLAVPYVVSAFGTQHQAILRRDMQFKALVRIQLVTQSLTLVATAAFAAIGWNYWALVGGALVASFVNVTLAWTSCRWVPSRPRKGVWVKDLLALGGRITAFQAVNYFSRNMDNVLVGRVLGSNALGFYSKAYQLMLMPITLVQGAVYDVAMSALSALKDEPARYEKYFVRLVQVVAAAGALIAIGTALEADLLVHIVLGPQWSQVAGLYRVLAIVGLLQTPLGLLGLAQVSTGASSRYLRWGLAGACVYVTSFVVGVRFGVMGVAVAYTVASVGMVVPTAVYCLHGTPVRVREYLLAVARPVAIGLASAAAALLAGSVMGRVGGTVRSLSTLAVFAAFFVSLSALGTSNRETLAWGWRTLRRSRTDSQGIAESTGGAR